MPVTPEQIRLTKTRPVDGMPNPYRTRWYEHQGVVFEVKSDRLDGMWEVAPDTDLPAALATGGRLGEPYIDYRVKAEYAEKLVHGGGIGAYWRGPHSPMTFEFRLADVRTWIAGLINSPDWPAIRDAYRALRADLDPRARHHAGAPMWQSIESPAAKYGWTYERVTVAAVHHDGTYTVTCEDGQTRRVHHHELNPRTIES